MELQLATLCENTPSDLSQLTNELHKKSLQNMQKVLSATK